MTHRERMRRAQRRSYDKDLVAHLKRQVGKKTRRNLAAMHRNEMISRKMLGALNTIGQKLTSVLDLNELLSRILDLSIENVRAERGIVFLRDEQSGEMRAEWAVIWVDAVAWRKFGRHFLWGRAAGDDPPPEPVPMPERDLLDNPFRWIIHSEIGRFVMTRARVSCWSNSHR